MEALLKVLQILQQILGIISGMELELHYLELGELRLWIG